MRKKQTKKHNYYCKTCGFRFGDDSRAFEVGTLKDGAKDWHCYFCKIDEMSPETLKEFAKLQLNKINPVNNYKHENRSIKRTI